MKQELEDAQKQLKIVGKEKKMFLIQFNRVLALAKGGGNSGPGGHSGHMGFDILQFSGIERQALQGWIIQLDLK
jgi:hypothetical protein